MAETYSGEFYCVKCKGKVQTAGEVVVSDTGRKAAKATCPDCNTKLTRFLPKG